MDNKYYGIFTEPTEENYKHNIQVFSDYDFVQVDGGYINMYEYLMCSDDGPKHVDLFLSKFGIDVSEKKIGYKYTLLFLIKDQKYINSIINTDDPKIISDEERNSFELFNTISKQDRYITADYIRENITEFRAGKKVGEKLNLLDETFLTAIAMNSPVAINGYLDYLIENNNRLFYKRIVKIKGITNFYTFENNDEIDNFESEILLEDPKFVYKINYCLGMNKKHSPFYTNILVASPYHVFYHFKKKNPLIFDIISFTNLENVKLVADKYGFSPVIKTYEKYETKELFCKNQFVKSLKFLLNNLKDNEYMLLYKNFLLFNSFVDYVLNGLKETDDNNVVRIPGYEKFLKKPQIDDCNINIEAYERLTKNITLKDVFEAHLNSNKEDLFIYKFEDTLGLSKNGVWRNFLIYPKDTSLIGMISPEGLDKFISACKINKPIIFVTNENESKDLIIQIKNLFKFNPYIIYKEQDTLPSYIEENWDIILQNLGKTNVSTISFVGNELLNYDYLKDKLKVDIKYFLASIYNETYSKELIEYKIEDYIGEVSLEPTNIAIIPERFKNDKTIVKEVVSKDGILLKYASDELRNDEDIVLTSIKNNPFAYNFASPILKQDSKIITEALKGDGMLLKDIPDIYKGDNTYFSIAMISNPSSYRYGTIEMRKNINNAIYALEADPDNYNYIPNDILSDPRIVKISEMYSSQKE